MHAALIIASVVYRLGLQQVLASAGFRVSIVPHTPREALVGELARLAPEVVFLSSRVTAEHGPTLIDALREASPESALIMIGRAQNPALILEAMRRGVSCFLCREITPQSVVLAAEAATRGYVLVDDPALFRSAGGSGTGAASIEGLTPREREVLALVAQGLTNGEIAARLVISPGTVRSHVSNILAKLNLTDRVQAAVRAAEMGLVPAEPAAAPQHRPAATPYRSHDARE
ncbi:MAG: response regulator transcription factor [Anaerolineae bacterium]|nr:response regulator transcription factor [Anaerolineae bacterium]